MILALSLLVGTIIVGASGHRLLRWLGQRRVDPGVLLSGWVVSSCGLLVSSVGVLSAAAVPGEDRVGTGLLHLASRCWTALSSGELPRWREAVALLALICLALMVVRIGWVTVRQVSSRRRHRRQSAGLRMLAAGAIPAEPLWINDDRPMALTVSGRPGLIVMTEGLRRELGADALAAALEHERAHLRGRHHGLLAIVDLVSDAFPVGPLLRAAPAATRELVEFAADAAAARQCGAAAVGEALRALTGRPAPVIGLGMAGQLTAERLDRLACPASPRSPWGRTAGFTAVAALALALPALLGSLLIAAIGCILG